jgi:hypothetical protein
MFCIREYSVDLRSNDSFFIAYRNKEIGIQKMSLNYDIIKFHVLHLIYPKKHDIHILFAFSFDDDPSYSLFDLYKHLTHFFK